MHQQESMGTMETTEPQLVVFDLDNTLRNNEGSAHVIPMNLGLSMDVAANWAPWQHYVNEMSPTIPYMADLYTSMCVDSKYEVWIITSSSFGTRDWLQKHGLPLPKYLHERAITDNASPREFKESVVEDLLPTITLWVDDCPKMCAYMRDKNIKVLQVTHNYYEHQK